MVDAVKKGIMTNCITRLAFHGGRALQSYPSDVLQFEKTFEMVGSVDHGCNARRRGHR